VAEKILEAEGADLVSTRFDIVGEDKGMPPAKVGRGLGSGGD
jgi:hypothetical protein